LVGIKVTHDGVPIDIRVSDPPFSPPSGYEYLPCRATSFGNSKTDPAVYKESGAPLNNVQWGFNDFLRPDETFDHFKHYNGSGDWKFEFTNKNAANNAVFLEHLGLKV